MQVGDAESFFLEEKEDYRVSLEGGMSKTRGGKQFSLYLVTLWQTKIAMEYHIFEMGNTSSKAGSIFHC